MIEPFQEIRLTLSPLSRRIQDLGATGKHDDDLNRIDIDNYEVNFQYLRHIRADKTEHYRAVNGGDWASQQAISTNFVIHVKLAKMKCQR